MHANFIYADSIISFYATRLANNFTKIIAYFKFYSRFILFNSLADFRSRSSLTKRLTYFANDGQVNPDIIRSLSISFLSLG